MTRHVRTTTRIAAILLVSLQLACAATTRSKQAQVAIQGENIGQTISQILTATTQLREAGALPAEQALRVAQLAKQASEYGQRLEGVLKIINATGGASDPGTADQVSTARQLVDQIVNTSIGIIGAIGNNPATAQVRTLLETLLKTTNTILFQLGEAS